MRYTYQTTGVCSSRIDFEVENGVLTDLHFTGGCNGNGNGIVALCKGMAVEDIIERVRGIRCGIKETSCPDQLAKALEEALYTAVSDV